MSDTNAGLGMVPCRKNCRCTDCQIDALRARVAFLEGITQRCLFGDQKGDCYAAEAVDLRAENARLRAALEQSNTGPLAGTQLSYAALMGFYADVSHWHATTRAEALKGEGP